jgi:hypothetical protein
MPTCGLTVELEAARLQLADDLSVSEPGKAAHSSGDYDRVVSPIAGSRQIRNAVALASSCNQFPSDVACNVERLSDGPALRNEAGDLIRSCEKQPFGQFLDLDIDRQLHTNRW